MGYCLKNLTVQQKEYNIILRDCTHAKIYYYYYCFSMHFYSSETLVLKAWMNLAMFLSLFLTNYWWCPLRYYMYLIFSLLCFRLQMMNQVRTKIDLLPSCINLWMKEVFFLLSFIVFLNMHFWEIYLLKSICQSTSCIIILSEHIHNQYVGCKYNF